MTAASGSTLAERVQKLIDDAFGGSVLAAAKAAGVPHRTLARIASGEVEHPRVDALEKIAEFYNTTVDWLLSGRGEAPKLPKLPAAAGIPTTGGAWYEWGAIVRELELSEPVADAVLLLPTHLLMAYMLLKNPGARGSLGGSFEREVRLWSDLFRKLIDADGAEHVRNQLTTHLNAVHCGFQIGPHLTQPKASDRRKATG